LQELFYGILIVLILLFQPRGLVEWLARRLPMFRERYYRE
jgi:ABC-type branched-subunit amino acid transport system permease subunit